MDNSSPNKSAHQKPSMLNPFTNLLASKTVRAFITSRNNPSVSMDMGMVSITRIGRMTAFMMAKTKAKTMAVQNVSR